MGLCRISQHGLPPLLLRLQHVQLPGAPAGLRQLVVVLVQAGAHLLLPQAHCRAEHAVQQGLQDTGSTWS